MVTSFRTVVRLLCFAGLLSACLQPETEGPGAIEPPRQGDHKPRIVCPGGLRTAASHGVHLRWGRGSGTVVTYSFIAAPELGDAEDVDPGELVKPLIENIGEADERGIAPFPIDAGARIRAALGQWEQVADISFHEVYEPEAIGDIRFGHHAIGHPLVLAHGYLPDPPADLLSGDVHFRSSWTDSPEKFEHVAVHEIGHAIGLGHILDPANGVLMSVYLDAPRASEDIAYAQHLYGPARARVQTSPRDGTVNAITWEVPQLDGAPLDQHLGSIVDVGNDDVAVESVTLYPTIGFELDMTPMALTTLTEGAELGASLFDLTVGDSLPDVVAWETDMRAPLSGQRSFQIDRDRVDGERGRYPLPQHGVTAFGTASTEVAFRRESLLNESESFTAGYVVDNRINGHHFVPLLFERGSDVLANARRFASSNTFQVPEAADLGFRLRFLYSYGGTFWTSGQLNPGVQIDDIEIRNVQVPQGDPSTVNVLDPDARSVILDVELGLARIKLRTLYDSGVSSGNATGYARLGLECTDPCGLGCQAVDDCSSASCGEANACGTVCGTSCDAGCAAVTDCNGVSCGATNACGTSCGTSCDVGCPAVTDCSAASCGEANACGTSCGTACDVGCPALADCSDLSCGAMNACGTVCGTPCDTGCAAVTDCSDLSCGTTNACGTACGTACDDGCPALADCSDLSCGAMNACGTVCGTPCDAGCAAVTDCSAASCGDTNACGTSCGTACDDGCPAADDCSDLSCGETNTCGTACGTACDDGCPALADCSDLSCGTTNACGTACGTLCDVGCPGVTDCSGVSCGEANACGTLCDEACDTTDAGLIPADADDDDPTPSSGSGCVVGEGAQSGWILLALVFAVCSPRRSARVD